MCSYQSLSFLVIDRQPNRPVFFNPDRFLRILEIRNFFGFKCAHGHAFRLHVKTNQSSGGATVSKERGLNRVPKRDLVSVVQVALQNGRLRIAEKLPNAATLVKELQNFQGKITHTGNDSYGAWREGRQCSCACRRARLVVCRVLGTS
jgi:hypothetical protein